MKIAYFPKFCALQSDVVLKAFLHGCIVSGIKIEEESYTADAAVIWSVLWHGRMASNKQVYEHYRKQNKPVFIIEVGSLRRGYTWKICINNINSSGIYPIVNLNSNREKFLNIHLSDWKTNRQSSILIATQHEKSLQWENMPTVQAWVMNTIKEIRQYTDRDIIVRPHPRWLINVPAVTIELPKKIEGSYSIFDINYNHHCIINHNSGVGTQSVIFGTPVICDNTSLAFPMSSSYQDIENLKFDDREDWFLKICHTEWTVNEIEMGIPQKKLLDII